MTITLNDVSARADFTASSGQTVFAFNFRFFVATDLSVYKNGTVVSSGLYTVAGANATSGQQITLATGATAGDKIAIIRTVPYESPTQLPVSGPLQVDSLNLGLTKIVAMLQQLRDADGLSLRTALFDTAPTYLPSLATRAGKLLAFDASGNPVSVNEIGNWRSSWAAATAYIVRDLVKDGVNSNIYRCNTAHTSAGTAPISGNANAAYWDMVVDGSAGASATAAAASASAASVSASTATTQASNASASATSAVSAKTAAESARDATLAAYDSFDDRYLGAKSTNPTLDNDGNTLVGGTLYFDTTNQIMKLYTGSAWVAAYASLSGALIAANNLSDLASVSSARTNLGLGVLATAASATVAQGGTGQTTLTANAVLIGNGTGAVAAVAPSTAGNVLTSTGSAWVSTPVTSATLTGSILLNGAKTVPAGYLKCDGATYNISAYPALAAAIGSLPVSYAQTYYSNRGFLSLANGILIAPGPLNYYSANSGVTWSLNTLVLNPAGSYNTSANTVWTGSNYVSGSMVSVYCCGSYSWGWANGIQYSSTYPSNGTHVAFGTAGVPVGSLVTNGAGRVLAFTDTNGVYFYSTNHGVSWTQGPTTPSSMYIAAFADTVVWASNLSLFVIAGRPGSTGGSGTIATSPDGITWTSRTVPSPLVQIGSLSYTNNTLIAIDLSGNLASSTDGITWTYKTNVSNKAYHIAYLASTGLYYGKGYVSEDLINWVAAPLRVGSSAYSNTYNITDGTRIFSEIANYIPAPYTTATQFVVPDLGGLALGSAPAWGTYYNIKT